MARLEALAPAYLSARVERDAARKAATSARGRAEAMVDKNRRHAAEVARGERDGYGAPMVTNAYTQIHGGSGVTVVYSRCRHDDPTTCDHDARSSPWSEDQITDAYAAADTADELAAAAVDRFHDLEGDSASFDVAAVALAAGARFVWWPPDRFVNPTRAQYRGQIVTAAELDLIGPFELRRLINSGGVVEVMG